METPDYLRRPPFSDNNAVRLPILEKTGYEEEEDDPGCRFSRIQNGLAGLAEVYFIDTKNILIGLEYESSEFASLVLRMNLRPEAPVDALLSIELVHNHHFETGDTSKNRCLNRIVSFSEKKYRHKLANCLQLEKAKKEGFVITRETPKGGEDGFIKKTDPGTYLSVRARSFMLACYGEEVTREIRDLT
ncbi:hypothetical protein C5167_003804 [Papaver somniferum]|uniref:Uncharacterized protein n=1 Tax=Papaver somniferum TaxID=3469 RepID=A0A4Y7L3J5_PAPSO|nr:hypothetical protein C5167_003804 [Papaver somniferum]